MKPIKQFYQKVITWGRTEKALFIIAFVESSFFPIPPDPILMNMTLSKPDKWKRYALITTIASILGGVLGYVIGLALFESVGQWIIDTYHLQDEFTEIGEIFKDNGLLAIFAAAITPIPYKIFTITAGAFSLNLGTFLFASILGRGMRFTAVAYAVSYFGKKYEDKIQKYIDLISFGVIALVIIVFVGYSQLK